MSDEYSLVPSSFQVFGQNVGFEISVAADVFAGLSVIFAIIAFLINQSFSRRVTRREHTVNILSIINQEGPVSRAQLKMAVWIRDEREFPDDNVSEGDDQAIVALLDYYDFVSHNIKNKSLDVETVKVLFGGRMRSTYRRLKRYIAARRARLKRQDLYKPFEDVVLNVVSDADV